MFKQILNQNLKHLICVENNHWDKERQEKNNKCKRTFDEIHFLPLILE